MNNIDNEQEQKVEEEATDEASPYIQALKEMKENSVERSKYEKLQRENAELINALKDGRSIPSEEVVEGPSVQQLSHSLMHEHMNNLEFARKALLLRDKLIEEQGEGADPFLPQGIKTRYTNEDRENAQNLADVLQQCIDESDGDPAVFQARLMSRTKDNGPIMGKRRK